MFRTPLGVLAGEEWPKERAGGFAGVCGGDAGAASGAAVAERGGSDFF